MVVQWLHAPNTRIMGSILGQGTKNLNALRRGQKKKS